MVRRLNRIERIPRGPDCGVECIAGFAKRSKRFVMAVEDDIDFRPIAIAHASSCPDDDAIVVRDRSNLIAVVLRADVDQNLRLLVEMTEARSSDS